MPALTIHDIPEDVLRCLRERAARHHHSLDEEARMMIERAVIREARSDELDWLDKVRRLRGRLPVRLTDAWIEQALNEGRP